MRRPASTPSAAEPLTVRIARLGAEGDGVAALPDGRPLFVPFTLPGELVRATPIARRGDGMAARLDAVLQALPDRVDAPCRHFGTCGGCTAQHLGPGAYAAWKTGLLREALRRAGYPDAPVAPLAGTGPGERRRMDFAALRTRDGVTLGLHARGGPVVGLTECLVLHPALSGLLAPLRPLLAGLQGMRREASVIANLLDNGPDLLLRTDADLTTQDRAALAGFARAHDLPRIAWARGGGEPEPVVIRRPPVAGAPDRSDSRRKAIALGGGADAGRPSAASSCRRHPGDAGTGGCVPHDAGVGGGPAPATTQDLPATARIGPATAQKAAPLLHPPPGAFLQATAGGEAAIAAAVLAGLPDRLPPRARIAELHAGCGTLTFALAQRARVAAFEGDAAAVATLRAAAATAGLGGRIEATRRDLARQPLSARELAGFAAVVLDPPHAGAAAQAAQIAAAAPARVIYASCNPATLARDARLLQAAGWRLLSATPIDQFLWSARLESVCVFGRG